MSGPEATEPSGIDLGPFLETVIENPELHIRWLKTLSLLEHTGARKIHKSIPDLPGEIRYSESILQHAAEEARHAHFFAKQAVRQEAELSAATKSDTGTNPESDFFGPLCQWAGIKYFQRLDALCRNRALELFGDSVSSRSQRTLFCYLSVTYLIEERAVQVYSAYEVLLRDREVPIHLGGILKEEEGHMEEILEMGHMLDASLKDELDMLRPQEWELFARFADRLSAEVLQAGILQALP